MNRQKLPDRRAHEVFNFEVSGLRYTCGFSRFADGSVGEIFLSSAKQSSQSDVNARDAGILLSFCLQYGCPVEDIARVLSRNSDGSASGVMAAVLDLIVAEEK